MIQLRPIPLYFPKSPTTQSLENYNDLKTDEWEQYRKMADHFIHVIESESPLLKWQEFLRQEAYTLSPKRLYTLRVSHPSGVYNGFLSGIDIRAFLQNKIYLHENIIARKVTKMKTYLDQLQLQAEAVVIGFEFSEDLHDLLDQIQQTTEKSRFQIGEQDYTLWEVPTALEKKIVQQKWTEAYLVDGHHRAACLSAVHESHPNTRHDLFSYCVDLKAVKTAGFLWVVKNPCSDLLQALKQLRSEQTADPSPQLNVPQFLWGKKAYLMESANQVDILEQVYNLLVQHKAKIEYLPVPQVDKKYFHQLLDKGALIFGYPEWSIDALAALAKAGNVLPPKSTYNRPKIGTGFAIAPSKKP